MKKAVKRSLAVWSLVLAAGLAQAALAAIEPQRVIIDTDLGSSVDDLFALDLAARLHKAGKLNLMAVMMNRPDGCDPDGEGRFLDFADRYLNTLGFDREFPLGRSEPLPDGVAASVVINPYWTLVSSNEVTDAWFTPSGRDLDSVTNAVALYRRLLNEAPEKSVVICSIGFFNNLRALMESGSNQAGDDIALTGLDLITAKVKELRIMGGCFDGSVERDRGGKGEYNVEGDIPSAVKIFAEWPTPIVVTPWEVGMKFNYRPEDVLADYPVGTLSPTIRAVYERWPNPPEGFVNRQWDPMTILPLTEGEMLAPLSETGGIAVDASGVTTFTPNASSNRCYQVASNMNETVVLDRFRAVCRTGNPSVTLLESGTPVPGVDYNGSEMVFTFKDIQCGAYEEWDLTFSFTIDGVEYAPESSEWDETLGVLSVRFAIPSDAVTAGNVYEGTLTVELENDVFGSVQVMTAPRQLVQGVIEEGEINSNLAWIDGVGEYATVANAVAAAAGRSIRLLHAASWSPSVSDLGKSFRFLDKRLLVLDDSASGCRANWSDVDGDNGTLTLGCTVTPEDPVVFATAEAATNALSGAVFVPSAEVADLLESDAARERYAGWFGLDVVSRGGAEWAVEATLTDAAKARLGEVVLTATRQIPVAAIAAMTGNATTNVTVVGCEPGFYYTLYGGQGLTALPTTGTAYGPALCGADGKVVFPAVAKPSEMAGFFTIGVGASKQSSSAVLP